MDYFDQSDPLGFVGNVVAEQFDPSGGSYGLPVPVLVPDVDDYAAQQQVQAQQVPGVLAFPAATHEETDINVLAEGEVSHAEAVAPDAAAQADNSSPQAEVVNHAVSPRAPSISSTAAPAASAEAAPITSLRHAFRTSLETELYPKGRPTEFSNLKAAVTRKSSAAGGEEFDVAVCVQLSRDFATLNHVVCGVMSRTTSASASASGQASYEFRQTPNSRWTEHHRVCDLAWVSEDFLVTAVKGEVLLRRASTVHAVKTRAQSLARCVLHEKNIREIAVSADRRSFLSGGDDCIVCLTDIAAGMACQSRVQEQAPVSSVRWNPDDANMYSYSLESGDVVVRDLRSPEKAMKFQTNVAMLWAHEWLDGFRIVAGYGNRLLQIGLDKGDDQSNLGGEDHTMELIADIRKHPTRNVFACFGQPTVSLWSSACTGLAYAEQIQKFCVYGEFMGDNSLLLVTDDGYMDVFEMV